MKRVKVYHYDSFSDIPNMGNPAGVVLDGETLSEEQMREVAGIVGFNETAFPIPSDKADLRIRFFTPGHEINLCGHATIATLYALKMRGALGEKLEFTVETKAGILPMKLMERNHQLYIVMRQAAPQFQSFNGSHQDLAYSLGLEESDIEQELPTLYGSTGVWTLLVPIRKLSAFTKMNPKNKIFPSILKEMPRVNVIHRDVVEIIGNAVFVKEFEVSI